MKHILPSADIDKSLTRDTTNAVKGIFIIIVFYSHIIPYFTTVNADSCFLSFRSAYQYTGQWMVAMFLFYSGYGVINSIIAKGQDYIRNIPVKRISNTWINFAVAVCVYLIVQQYVFEEQYTTSTILSSLIGWKSVGNSNWYIFVILLCYLMTYLIFSIVRNVKSAVLTLLIACAIVAFALSFYKPSYWYDTILCYPLGALLAIYKARLKNISTTQALTVMVMAIAIFILINVYEVWQYCPVLDSTIRGLQHVAFAISVLAFTMVIQIKSSLLRWFGVHLFPLYIYQRLPIIILKKFDGGYFMSNFPFTYIILCLTLTVAIGYIYKYIEIRIDKVSMSKWLGWSIKGFHEK